jgi:hypothetical protein
MVTEIVLQGPVWPVPSLKMQTVIDMVPDDPVTLVLMTLEID